MHLVLVMIFTYWGMHLELKKKANGEGIPNRSDSQGDSRLIPLVTIVDSAFPQNHKRKMAVYLQKNISVSWKIMNSWLL